MRTLPLPLSVSEGSSHGKIHNFVIGRDADSIMHYALRRLRVSESDAKRALA